MSWKFYDITHKYHTILNPSNLEKIDRLVSLLKLKPDAKVLEIATGKGELITQIIERYGVSGVAVDLSPDHSRDARARFAERIPDANLTFLEMDGADYQPDEPESFDLTLCLGAIAFKKKILIVCHARRFLSGIQQMHKTGFPLKACGNDKCKSKCLPEHL